MNIVDSVISHYKKLTKWKKNVIGSTVMVIGGIISSLCIRNVYLKFYRKYYGLPDGPNGIPIFGSFLSIASDSNSFYIWLSNCFGPITTYQYGMRSVISINDPKCLKKIFSNKYTLDRYPSWSPNKYDMHFGFINGKQWSDRRKILLSQLSQYMKSDFIDKNVKNCMNKWIIKDIDQHIQDNNNNNNLFYLSSYFHHITFNTIITALFGKKYVLKHNDEWLLEYTELNEKWTNEFFKGLIANLLFPNFFKLSSKGPFFVITKQRFELLNKLRISKINDNDIDNTDINKDECLWNLYMNNNNISMNEQQILWDLEVVVGASIETTSESMSWCIYLATKYPNIQNQVYNELLNAFGDTNVLLTNIEYLQKIPKLRAFIYETQRFITLLPMGLFHSTSKDIEIDIGNNKIYKIPKNTLIHPNMIGIHSNNKYWKYEKFNLNNWLDDEGKFKMNESFVGFGIGKRDCPGKAFAIKLMQLVMAILFFKYEFHTTDTTNIMPIQIGLVNKPSKPIGVKVRSRV